MTISPHSISGATMDQPAPRPKRRLATVAAILLILPAAAALWRLSQPDALRVPLADIRIASVERAVFLDEIAVRASAVPLHSVMLDAIESGRVEAVLVRDGAEVQQGQVLFRLSNSQRRLELLEREAERAQQISNAMTLRVNLDAARAERERRLSDQRFALELAERQHARETRLAEQGFVSHAALDDSGARVAQLRRQYASDMAAHESQECIRKDAIHQMDQAIARLETGLRLVSANVAALAVRAPASGRLTNFKLEVGRTVSNGQDLGRIDDPGFKLNAHVDEYYLQRVQTGRAASATIGGTTHALTVGRIQPQVSEGRFAVELTFNGAPPAKLQPGQSLDAVLSLGDSAPALVLPNDAWISDASGLCAFVLSADGKSAERRTIRIGRRSQRQAEVLAGLAPGERVIVSTYTPFRQAARLALFP